MVNISTRVVLFVYNIYITAMSSQFIGFASITTSDLITMLPALIYKAPYLCIYR